MGGGGGGGGAAMARYARAGTHTQRTADAGARSGARSEMPVPKQLRHALRTAHVRRRSPPPFADAAVGGIYFRVGEHLFAGARG